MDSRRGRRSSRRSRPIGSRSSRRSTPHRARGPVTRAAASDGSTSLRTTSTSIRSCVARRMRWRARCWRPRRAPSRSGGRGGVCGAVRHALRQSHQAKVTRATRHAERFRPFPSTAPARVRTRGASGSPIGARCAPRSRRRRRSRRRGRGGAAGRLRPGARVGGARGGRLPTGGRAAVRRPDWGPLRGVLSGQGAVWLNHRFGHRVNQHDIHGAFVGHALGMHLCEN